MRPSSYFVNRILNLLRASYNTHSIQLSDDFRRDLRCFSQFFVKYNGISYYDFKNPYHVLELNACFVDMGGRRGNFVYHLTIPENYKALTIVNFVYHLTIPENYKALTIVNLEMVNIFLVVHLLLYSGLECKF